MRSLSAFVWRNLRAHSLRSALTTLAIALGVAMILAASIMGAAANHGATALSGEHTRAEVSENVQFDALLVQGGLAMVGVIILFAAGFVILNAFAMSITARTREIGALRALGMTRRQVLGQVLVEASALGAVGSALGVVVGAVLAYVVMQVIGVLDETYFAVPWWGVLFSLAVGLGMTLVGALQPAWRASRLSPMLALRPLHSGDSGGWYIRYGGRVGSGLLIVVLLGLSGFAVFWRPDFIVSAGITIVGVALMLAAVILLLPALVDPVARLARPALVRWLGTAGRLAADNLARNKLRTVLTTGALIAALTTIIATGGLLLSTLKSGLHSYGRLFNEDILVCPDILSLIESGDLSVQNSTELLTVEAAFDPALIAQIEQLAESGEFEFFRIGFARIPAPICPYPGTPGLFIDPELYLRIGNFDFFEGDSEHARQWMARGRAVLLQPITAGRLGVHVGDTIAIETLRGAVEFTVAGIGGNGHSFTTLAYADGETYFGVERPSWYGVVVRDEAKIDVVLRELVQITDSFAHVTAVEVQEAFYRDMFKMIDQLQVLLQGFLLLAVVVASLGVVNTMFINVAERGKEIALLRAVGATQKQVRQAVIAEGATLGLLAALVAAGLGLVMFVLFIVVFTPGGTESVGIRSNWEIFWIFVRTNGRDLLFSSLLSLIFGPLAAGLAAYYPARQAAAMDVIDATRSERLTLRARRAASRQRRRMRKPMLSTSIYALAWRSLTEHPARTFFSAIAVTLGVGVIIAAGQFSEGILDLEAEENLLASFIDMLGLILNAVGFVILIAAGFLIFNAFAMAVTQRRRQIGMLRALGMTRRQVLRQLMTEASITGGLGTALGLALGPLLGWGLLRLIELLGVEVGQGRVTPGSVILAVSMGMGITLLAVMIPARRATRLSPMTALRQERSLPAGTRRAALRPWIGAGIALVLLIYLILFPPGRWAGHYPPLEWIMCLLLAAPWLAALGLALPSLIDVTQRAARFTLARVWGATGRLIADNLGRDRRRVALTVLTFAVGLAMIGTMNGFLTFSNEFLMRTVAQGALSQASWFIYPFDRLSGVAQIDEFSNTATRISPAVQQDVAQLIEGRARMAEIYMVSVLEISSPMPGFPSLITDIDWLRRPGVYTLVEGDWDSAAAIMQSGCGVLITRNAAARNQAGVGTEIVVHGPNGAVNCTIAGIGYGNMASMAIIGLAAREAFVDGPPSSLIVWPAPGADLLSLEADLRALAERHDDAWLTTPQEEIQGAIDTSDQLEAITNGLLTLAVLAAALGVINTTMMSVTERRRELGLLRSVGATRGQVTTVVCGEAALIGLLGGAVGLIAGVGLTAIMCLSLGGIPFGMVELDPWQGLAESIPSALFSGAIGIFSMPFIAAGAAWWPSRSLLRGSAIATMRARHGLETARRPTRRQPAKTAYFLALRNLGQHRTRTTLTALAIALGAATVVATGVVNAGIRAAVEVSIQESVSFVVEMVGVGLGIAGAMILLAAGFLMFNAFGMAVTQRRRQIGALRALGMTRRQTVWLALFEAMVVGGAGTLLGAGVGPLLGRGVLLGMQLAGYEVGQGRTSPGSIALALAMGLSITLLSVWLPARRAARISPLAALQTETGKPESARLQTWRGVAGAAISLALFTYLLLAPPGRWTIEPWNYALPFILVAPWLGSLLLAAPALIDLWGQVLRAPLARLWKASGRLIADNLRRARRRALMTALTFAVGVMTIVAVSGVFNFMGKELVEYAQAQRLQNGLLPGWSIGAADFTQGVMNPGGMIDGVRPEIVAEVRQVCAGRAEVGVEYPLAIPEISALLVPGYFSSMIDLNVLAVPGNVSFVEGDLATALPIMEAGCGLLLAPAAAERHSAGVGDTLTIQSDHGPLDCTVAGVVVAGMIPVSFISPAVKDDFDLDEPTSVIVFPYPDADHAALEADLRAIDEKYGDDAWLLAWQENVDTVAEGADRVLELMSSLLVLAVLAAALGMINTMVMSVAERRRELGLFRAVGATRQQVMATVCGEAALIGLFGSAFGLIAGAGVSAIFVLTHGGNNWGYPDIDLVQAAWRSLRPATLNGLIGLAAAPFLSAIAAWFPARAILRGATIETMESARSRVWRKKPGFFGGSLRARFVWGAGALMIVVLLGLVSVIVVHARVRMEEQARDALRVLVNLDAGLIELGLPPDAQTLTLDALKSGRQFQADADMLLRFETLVKEMTAHGLVDLSIVDRDNRMVFGLDLSKIGAACPPLSPPDASGARSERVDGQWRIHAWAPVHNRAGAIAGSVRLTVEATEIQTFLSRLRNTLLAAGAIIAALGLACSWWLGGLFIRRFERAGRQPRNGLTLMLVLGLAAMVGALQLIALPIERRYVQDALKGNLLAAVEWIGQAAADGLAQFGERPAEFSLADWADPKRLFAGAGAFDLGRLQATMEQAQNDAATVAYSALVDAGGRVVLSDQLALIGTSMDAPQRTQIKDAAWRGQAIWVIATPLRLGRNGEQVGALTIAVKREAVEKFLDESRNLFGLSGIIAVLGGILVTQMIGSAIVAPAAPPTVRRLAGTVQSSPFKADARDELAVLAQAYNQMVIGLREREWLHDILGRFVSRDVAEAIRSGQVRLEGENRVVSVLFCDIRGFTARSERHSPEEMVALLNEYLPIVVDAAGQHAGTVNKFGGDSTLVIYGAPRDLPASAYQAILTALEIRSGLAHLNARLVQRGEAPLRVGIGINTGRALAGAVGPAERQEYTVIGDTVTLTSQIESLNKHYPEYDILIGDATYRALGAHRAEFELVALDYKPIKVWAVRARIAAQ